LTAKKLRNIQTLLKYVPEEFLQEYEFAIPNHSSVAETELAATTSAIQAINLEEKNTPTVTEIEDASTTQIKQAVPLLVQTLKDITENKSKVYLRQLIQKNAIPQREIKIPRFLISLTMN